MPDLVLPPGTLIDEFEIQGQLGVGGFGVVYRAFDRALERTVAIKEYLPADFAMRSEDQTVQPKSSAAQPTFEWGLKRFLDESRTLASFRHPNIVRVMRFFQANQTAYMVMEFIAGKALNEWVRTHGTLNEAGLVSIALPLLDGLEVIHKSGYLHRDIKPPNILVNDDGRPVLIDFGSARFESGDATSTKVTFHTPPVIDAVGPERSILALRKGGSKAYTDAFSSGILSAMRANENASAVVQRAVY